MSPGLAEIWSLVEEDMSQSRGIVVRRVAEQCHTPIYIGVSKPANERLCRFDFTTEHVSPGVIPRVSGINIEMRPGTPGRGGTTQLLLRPSHPRYNELFAYVVQDLVSHVAKVEGAEPEFIALSQRLQRWKKFFEARPDDGLTLEAQRGLFAELHFIQTHLLGWIGADQGVYSWTGPLSEHQDFHIGPVAIEVKSSVSSPSVRIRISDVRQLEDAPGGLLFLVVVLLDPEQGTGSTLNQLVDSVAAQLAAQPSAAFELFHERLLAQGYIRGDRPEYDSIKYLVRGEFVFKVAGAFPRVLERDLPVGVGDLQYSIDLSALAPYRVEFDFLRSVLGQR